MNDDKSIPKRRPHGKYNYAEISSSWKMTTQSLPSPRPVFPKLQLKLTTSSFLKQLTKNLRVIFIAPQVSDFNLFQSVYCQHNKNSLCSQLSINKSQQWHDSLSSCYGRTKSPKQSKSPSDSCSTSTLIYSFQSQFPSFHDNNANNQPTSHLVITLSTVDYLPHLLNSSLSNNQNKFLLVSLYSPIPLLSQQLLSSNESLFVCHPSLWNQPTLIHPFDILSCLQMKSKLQSSLVPIKSLTLNQVQTIINKYFQYYNSIIAFYSSQNRIESLPINLFTLSQQSTNSTTQSDLLFNFHQMNSNYSNKLSYSLLSTVHLKLNSYFDSSREGNLSLSSTFRIEDENLFQDSNKFNSTILMVVMIVVVLIGMVLSRVFVRMRSRQEAVV